MASSRGGRPRSVSLQQEAVNRSEHRLLLLGREIRTGTVHDARILSHRVLGECRFHSPTPPTTAAVFLVRALIDWSSTAAGCASALCPRSCKSGGRCGPSSP